jgi:hypothetical protein
VTAPEPPPDEEDRPWERPGAVRRDCAPHRGQLLRWLATLALLAGTFAGVCFVPIVLSLPLGLTVLVAAGYDLRRMRRGHTDPGGRGLTRDAFVCALVALLVPLLGWLLWTLLVVFAQLSRR